MAAPGSGIDGITTRGELARFVEEQVLGDLPQKVARLVGALGGKRWRAGLATVTWPGGSSISTELTVTHDLGDTPKQVLVTVQTSGQGEVIAAHAGAYTATTFKIQAEWVKGFAPGAGSTVPVAWVATL